MVSRNSMSLIPQWPATIFFHASSVVLPLAHTTPIPVIATGPFFISALLVLESSRTDRGRRLQDRDLPAHRDQERRRHRSNGLARAGRVLDLQLHAGRGPLGIDPGDADQ